MEAATFTPFDGGFITKKLREEQCLLVLGPEVYTDPTGITYRQKLINYLNPTENPRIFRHYQEDDLFLFDQLTNRTRICYDIEQFYKDAQPNKTLQLIAQIPFHIILTVTPDKILHKAFDQLDLKYQFGFYKKNKDPQPIEAPTQAYPLLYNVFGCAESEESIVLTHNDLYDYFKSIFARSSMPDELKLQLKEVKNIIFLGIDFEKWYMQLLLRELEIHNQQYAFTRYAANQTIADHTKTLCVDQFQIQFVARNIDTFIEGLHRQCQVEGILRKPVAAAASHPQQIKKLVREDKLKDAIDLFCDLAANTGAEDAATLLYGQFSRLHRRVNLNVIEDRDRFLEESRISNSLLELLRDLEIH